MKYLAGGASPSPTVRFLRLHRIFTGNELVYSLAVLELGFENLAVASKLARKAFRHIERAVSAEGDLDAYRNAAVCLLPITNNRAEHTFVACARAFKLAVDCGAENNVAEAGLCLVGGNARDVFVHERGEAGEHMVVMRAAAVPAFPERRSAAVDPFRNTGVRALKHHLRADVAVAVVTESVHNELAAENAEIEVVVLFGNLLHKLSEGKRCYGRRR